MVQTASKVYSLAGQIFNFSMRGTDSAAEQCDWGSSRWPADLCLQATTGGSVDRPQAEGCVHCSLLTRAAMRCACHNMSRMRPLPCEDDVARRTSKRRPDACHGGESRLCKKRPSCCVVRSTTHTGMHRTGVTVSPIGRLQSARRLANWLKETWLKALQSDI